MMEVYEEYVGHPARSFNDVQASFEMHPQLLPSLLDRPQLSQGEVSVWGIPG